MPKQKASAQKNIEQWREQLLVELVALVPFEGWSEVALHNAATAAKLSDVELLRAFPDGVEEALHAFLSDVDAVVAQRLVGLEGWADMGMTARIKAALLMRFDVAAPNKELFRQVVAYFAVPWRAPLAAKRLYRTVDDMWYAAGDTATDFNFYTKRALLAGVYSATLTYWLNQEKDDPIALEGFVQRRLSDVMKIPKLKGKAKNAANVWQERAKDCAALAPHNVGENFSRALANWRLGS